MLHITIISVGKLKEQYWKDAEKEYLKRLSAFAKVEIKELKEESFTEKDNVEMIKQKEAEKIKDAIPKDSLVIALDKEGKQYSSEKLSEFFHNETMGQPACAGRRNNVTLIIGGPLGLHSSILQLFQQRLSLSSLTFTHQMSRVILLEQIYRGFMIKENRKYHY